VQYRLGGRKGRTRRITIGRHGELTPTTARAEAKRLLGEIAAGRDPATERDMTKAGKSLAMVLEQFMAEHVVRRLARRAKRWARSSIAVNGETGRSLGRRAGRQHEALAACRLSAEEDFWATEKLVAWPRALRARHGPQYLNLVPH
jgi:hypothetical protein